jgi:hypothetical protein
LISSAYSASFVHLEPIFFVPDHTYNTWHIDIACCRDPLVHMVAEWAFIKHNLISTVNVYVVFKRSIGASQSRRKK